MFIDFWKTIISMDSFNFTNIPVDNLSALVRTIPHGCDYEKILTLFLNYGKGNIFTTTDLITIQNLIHETIRKCEINSCVGVNKLFKIYGKANFDNLIPSSLIIQIMQKDYLSQLTALNLAHKDLDSAEINASHIHESTTGQINLLQDKSNIFTNI
jgi:hypothetical protein